MSGESSRPKSFQSLLRNSMGARIPPVNICGNLRYSSNPNLASLNPIFVTPGEYIWESSESLRSLRKSADMMKACMVTVASGESGEITQLNPNLSQLNLDLSQLIRTCHNLTRTCHNSSRTCHNLTRTCHNLIRTCNSF